MNAKEINSYLKGHENAFIGVINIMEKYIDKAPQSMIKELEDFN